METLKDIATKNEKVELQREERARIRKLIKHMKLEKRLKKTVEKNARVVVKQAKRQFNDNWTKDAIEEVGEKLHEPIKK